MDNIELEETNKHLRSVNLYLESQVQSLTTEIAELRKQLTWIPVEKELPYKDGKSDIPCLVKITNRGVAVRPYSEYHKCWDDEDGDDYFTDAIGGKITHWLPIPQINNK